MNGSCRSELGRTLLIVCYFCVNRIHQYDDRLRMLCLAYRIKIYRPEERN